MVLTYNTELKQQNTVLLEALRDAQVTLSLIHSIASGQTGRGGIVGDWEEIWKITQPQPQIIALAEGKQQRQPDE